MSEMDTRLVQIVSAIDDVAQAVKTQDNHVLSDLDTYQVTTALNEIRDELQKTNLNLIAIKNELNNISIIMEAK